MTSAFVMAGAALSGGQGQVLAQAPREFYQLRKYTLQTGPQLALAQGYFEHALIPALNRQAMAPVGAFRLDIGPETPTYYVVIPSPSAEALATLDTALPGDAEFMKAAAAFWGAPASAPAFVRVESSLLSAFSGWPKIVAPQTVAPQIAAPQIVVPQRGSTSAKPSAKRIFQLRTYESPSYAGHVRKVQMFNEGEIGIFVRTGLAPVFFGDTLIGPRLPSLTYMLTFSDTAELNEKWMAFVADPEWKELSHRPQNADAELVSNISNLYLSPLDCSQI